jgi:phosphomannomutase
LHCDGTGIFPHIPEPLPENLTSLSEAVKRFGADLGIAVDPDADRLVLIDENGDPISEEKTIALATDAVFSSKAFANESKA